MSAITNFKGRRSAEKNARTKQRNAARKAINLKAEADRKRLSPKDQLAALDFRLGAGQGAKRERAKLAERLTETV